MSTEYVRMTEIEVRFDVPSALDRECIATWTQDGIESSVWLCTNGRIFKRINLLDADAGAWYKLVGVIRAAPLVEIKEAA